MNATNHPAASWEIGALLRGDTQRILVWTGQWNTGHLARNIVAIFIGAGLYGTAMGWWRDPLQAGYVALKLPLIILLTALGNALLNAMLAPLLGLNIPFRQSFLAILMSFAIASSILGAFSPVIAFLVWNAPPMTPNFRDSSGPYSFIMLMHVAVITFAGVAANLRLKNLLGAFGGDARVARRVLLAWLAGNLFLGSQLSWVLRPFIGNPSLPVQFLRDDPFNGNFYEAVFHSFVHLLLKPD